MTNHRCIHCGGDRTDGRVLLQGGGPYMFCSVCVLDAISILASDRKYPFTKMLQHVGDAPLRKRLAVLQEFLPEHCDPDNKLHEQLSSEERMLLGQLSSNMRAMSG